MPTFLHYFAAWMTLTTTFTSADVKVDSSGVGARDLSLDGKVSRDNLLFLEDVSSAMACTSSCMKYECCVAFSTSPKDPASKTMTCRGHDSMSVSKTSTVEAPGSRTFFVERKQPETVSRWLGRQCTNVSDCPVALTNVMCFAESGQCLCQLGFYFSHCRQACVADCSSQDLQPTFLKYRNQFVWEPNHIKTENCSFEKARQICLENSDCRSFDICSSCDTCYLQRVTAVSRGAVLVRSTRYDYYQRNCL